MSQQNTIKKTMNYIRGCWTQEDICTAKTLQSLGLSPECTVLTRHMLPMRQSSVHAHYSSQGTKNFLSCRQSESKYHDMSPNETVN